MAATGRGPLVEITVVGTTGAVELRSGTGPDGGRGFMVTKFSKQNSGSRPGLDREVKFVLGAGIEEELEFFAHEVANKLESLSSLALFGVMDNSPEHALLDVGKCFNIGVSGDCRFGHRTFLACSTSLIISTSLAVVEAILRSGAQNGASVEITYPLDPPPPPSLPPMMAPPSDMGGDGPHNPMGGESMRFMLG